MVKPRDLKDAHDVCNFVGRKPVVIADVGTNLYCTVRSSADQIASGGFSFGPADSRHTTFAAALRLAALNDLAKCGEAMNGTGIRPSPGPSQRPRWPNGPTGYAQVDLSAVDASAIIRRFRKVASMGPSQNRPESTYCNVHKSCILVLLECHAPREQTLVISEHDSRERSRAVRIESTLRAAPWMR